LLKARRQQIHSKIVTILEENFLDVVTAQPALVAHHCTEAGLIEKAVGYWLKAGQLSVTRSTMTEAVAQLKKGLDLLGGLPNGTKRQEQELGLQITLGQAFIANRGFGAPEAGESYDRARQLCQHLNRPQLLGQVLVGQFVFRLVRAELDQAEHHAEELRHLGEARNDAMWKCFGLNRSATACTFLGKFIEARAYFENYLSFWDPIYRASWPSPEDLWVPSLLDHSRTLLCLVPELSGKQVELLKEIVPRLSRIAIFGIPGLNAPQFATTETAVRALALEAENMEVRVVDDFERALEAARTNHAEADILLSSPLVFASSRQIGELAIAKRLPLISLFGEFPKAGGFIAYGPNQPTSSEDVATTSPKCCMVPSRVTCRYNGRRSSIW
jgi:hypothetical protein